MVYWMGRDPTVGVKFLDETGRYSTITIFFTTGPDIQKVNSRRDGTVCFFFRQNERCIPGITFHDGTGRYFFFFFTTGRDRIVFVFFSMGRDGSSFSSTENVAYLCPPGHAAFHVTEAGHASLCGIIGCFRGEKPSLRVVGPPGQLQPDLRRRLAQSRPSAMPGRNRGRRKPGFSSLFASQKPHEHHVQPDHDFVETLIAVSQSPIPARGSGVALPQYPRDSKDDIAS